MKKLSIKILLLVIALISAVMFTACIGEKSLDDLLKEEQISADVTYYANGGSFNNRPSSVKKYFGISFKNGGDFAYAYPIAEQGTEHTIGRTDYVFDGWYYAELDENGEVVWADEAKTTPVISNKKAEFPLKVYKDEHIHLCAVWTEDVKVEFYLVSEIEVSGKDGKVYKNGDLLSLETFGASSSVDFSNKIPLESTNASCLQIYTDIDCITPLTQKVNKPTDGENVKLYAKYIEGVWIFVRNSTDVKAMFKGIDKASNAYYLLNDIDCGTQTEDGVNAFKCDMPYSFEATIKGNGYKVSNVYFEESGITPQYGTMGAFGELCSTANVSNFTLENVTINYTMRSAANAQVFTAFALFSSVEDGAEQSVVFDNFAINNLTFNITLSSKDSISNAPNVEGEYDKTHFLFGGYNTDAEFLATFGGFTVSNATLNITN